MQPSNVWFLDDCRAAKRLTRLMERRYKSTGQSVDKTAWILQLRSCHRICDVKCSLFWKCQIASNPKNLWNQISNVLGRTKQIAQSTHSTDIFADVFQDKVEKIRQGMVNAAPPSYSESFREWITEFHSVTEEEVLKFLMSSPNKQSSLDSLPTWLLKRIGVDIAPFLLHYLIDRLKKDMFQSVFKRPY